MNISSNKIYPAKKMKGFFLTGQVSCNSEKNALNYGFGVSKMRTAGFSIIETLVAIAIGVMVTIAVTGVSIQGLKDVRSLKRTERLHADTQFFTDEVASAIRQSIRIDVPSSTELRAVLPSKTMVFQKSGNTIILDDGGVVSTIVSDGTIVNDLRFEGFPRSVRYAFTLSSANGEETFSATTTSAQRNSP